MLRPLALAACLTSFATAAGSAAQAAGSHHSIVRVSGSPVVKGSGHEASETRAATGAHALRLDGAIDVTFSIGTPEQVVLTGDDNLLPLMTAEVEDGTLVLGARGSYDTRLQLRADVRLARLDRIDVRGSGDVAATVAPTTSFDVSIRGSGDVRVTGLSADTLSCRIEGSGDVTPSGRCARASVEIKGSGDFLGGGLACDDATVAIAGSGDVDVDAAKTLDVSIEGSGDVHYAGSPALTQKVRGSGEITKRP